MYVPIKIYPFIQIRNIFLVDFKLTGNHTFETEEILRQIIVDNNS